MTTEYSVRRLGRSLDAVITSGGEEVARVFRQPGGSFKLKTTGEEEWRLDPRVNAEVMPFSMTVTASGRASPILTVVRGVFLYENKFYMFMGVPEDVEPKDHVLDGRHIVRLDRFPFSRLNDIDRETWGRLRSFRGVSVADIEGLGLDRHTVTLSDELASAGMLLAAVSYVLYSTG